MTWLRGKDTAERAAWASRLHNGNESLGEVIKAVMESREDNWFSTTQYGSSPECLASQHRTPEDQISAIQLDAKLPEIQGAIPQAANAASNPSHIEVPRKVCPHCLVRSYPHTARHEKEDKQNEGASTAACTQTSMRLSRQLDHSISISDQPHPAHRDQLQIGRASPRALHTRDRDTAQASRQGHAKTTPVTQEPIDAQHYSETDEPATGRIRDPRARSPQSFRGSPPSGRDLAIRQQGTRAAPCTSSTKQASALRGNLAEKAMPPQAQALSEQKALSNWLNTSRTQRPVRHPLVAYG